MQTDHFFTAGHRTGGCSAVKPWGVTSITPGLPNPCCSSSCLTQLWIQRFWDPGRFLVWFSSLPPCTVPTSFFYWQWRKGWKHPWFRVRCFSPEHSESHTVFWSDAASSISRSHKPLCEPSRMSEGVNVPEPAVFRRRLQFQLNQTNFTVTFYQRQKSKLFLYTWAHLLHVEVQSSTYRSASHNM